MPPPTSKRAKPSPAKRIAHAAVEVINDWGLHARPSAALARLAKGFDAKTTIRNGDREASATSIAHLLMLEAVKGSQLELEAAGPDAEEALAALAGMFADGFGEDHKVLAGEGTRCGVAVGAVHILHQANDIPHYSIPKAAVAQEQKRLAQAVKEERRHVRELGKEGGSGLIAEFSGMMLGMLDEEHVAAQPAQHIRAGLVNAEWALKVCLDEVIEQFRASGNEVIQAHANDYSQLLLRLVGRMAATRRKRAKVREGTKRVVVSASVGPAEVIDCYRAGYAGFVTSSGSYSSHAAILARGLGMPALFAVDYEALRGLAEDTRLILDSDAGELHVKPDKEVVKRFAQKTARRPAPVRGKAPAATKTRDGVRVRLQANIEFVDELAPAYAAGAEGIGLYRTEFLFLNRDDEPSEEEQYVAYAAAVKGSGGRPVTFRTADIGHDKSTGNTKDFSAMGLRAIRHSLRHPAMFKAQLRALLRAGAHGPVRIMFPMIAHAHELEEAVRLLKEAATETGGAADRLPPVGTMIEIPGAVYAMPALARRSDFFAIGTNDLIQYVLAVDRNLAGVAELADPCHPGVVGLLAQTVRQGKELGREVTMCGELASDPLMACLYCTLGLRGLSMGAGKIEAVRAALGRHSIRGHRRLAARLAAGSSAAEIRELLQGFA